MPIPFIGALRKPEIIAISRSAEMVSYSVGGIYDRPLARRLLEEAGVPRHLFGQRKRAMALVFSRAPATCLMLHGRDSRVLGGQA